MVIWIIMRTSSSSTIPGDTLVLEAMPKLPGAVPAACYSTSLVDLGAEAEDSAGAGKKEARCEVPARPACLARARAARGAVPPPWTENAAPLPCTSRSALTSARFRDIVAVEFEERQRFRSRFRQMRSKGASAPEEGSPSTIVSRAASIASEPRLAV